jgi:S-adenosylmethionine:tRNA ribosyltransferase-isomerase
MERIDFILPLELEASEPPEARGLKRDQVRLMVSYRSNDHIIHTHFRNFPEFLDPGDVLVVNTSGTMNAALSGVLADGSPVEVHLSTHLPADLWVVELFCSDHDGQAANPRVHSGEKVSLPGGGRLTLLTAYRQDQRASTEKDDGQVRLWVASMVIPVYHDRYLARYGFPIRYKYVHKGWPLSYYQTVYATERGSAEMPSAGRAFTRRMISELTRKGIVIAPLLLHTGIASLEDHEPPYEEYYRIPASTAEAVNASRAVGHRVIAVGTTCMRALETVCGPDRLIHAGEGWTNLVITPQRGVRAFDGLLTGFHEPKSTHLAMLDALAKPEHIRKAYSVALEEGYLWHEFGDLHLILP